MASERSLGIRLQLLADFKGAADGAVSSLRSIVTGLEGIKEAGRNFEVAGFDGLKGAIQSVAGSATAATGAVDSFAKSVKLAGDNASAASALIQTLGNMMGTFATESDSAATGVERVEKSLNGINSGGLDSVTASMTFAGDQAQKSAAEVTALAAAIRDIPKSKTISIKTTVSGLSDADRALLEGGTAAGSSGVGTAAAARGPRANLMAPTMGASMIAAGSEMKASGKQMVGEGFEVGMVGAMVAGPMIEAVKAATDIEDLMKRNLEALRATGVSELNAQKLNDAMAEQTARFGGNFRDNTSGIYNFVSAAQSGITSQLNTQSGQDAMTEVYGRQAMLGVAGGSSTHPIDQGKLNLDTIAGVTNLGYDTSTPEKWKESMEKFQNVMINVKNRTSTEADLFAESVKALGPIAATEGLDPTDVIGLVSILAENKIRGAQAGNQIKRILSRESLTPKKLQDLQAFTRSAEGGGADISEYNADGSQKSMLDMIATIAKYQQDHKLSDKAKAQMDGLLAGQYAAPGFGALVHFSQQNGNDPAKPHAYAQSMVNGKQDPNAPGDALTQAYGTRSTGNLKVEEQKTQGAAMMELDRVFKLIEPDLASFVHGIGSMIAAFDRIPDPIKKVVVEAGLIGGVFMTAAGAALVFAGGLRLMGGLSFIKFGQLAEEAGKLGTTLAPLGEAFNVVRTALMPLGALLLTPVGAITALIAAGALFTVAWTKDWGGIREIVANAGTAIANGIETIRETLPGMVANAENALQGFGRAFLAAVPVVEKFVSDIGQTILNNGPKMLVQGIELAGNIIKGIIVGWAGIDIVINGFLLKMAGQFIQALPGMLAAGIKLIGSVADGIIAAIPGAIAEAAKITGYIYTRLYDDAAKLLTAGQHMIGQTVKGWTDKIESSVTDMQKIGPNLIDSLMKFDFSKVGESWIYKLEFGFMLGIPGFISRAVAAITKGMSQIAGAFHDGAIDAHSDENQQARDNSPQSGGSWMRNWKTNIKNVRAPIVPFAPTVTYDSAPSGPPAFNSFDQGINKAAGGEGTGRVKKARQGPMDESLELYAGEQVAKVEAYANKIEAALKAAGAKIKEGYIDLIENGKVVRVKGDLKSYEVAKEELKPESAYDQARDIGTKSETLAESGSLTKNAALDEIAALKNIKKKDWNELTVSQIADIDKMVADVSKRYQDGQKKLAEQLKRDTMFDTKDMNKLTGENGSGGYFADFDKTNTKFGEDQQFDQDALSRLQANQKNPDIASLKELNQQLTLELSSRKELQSILDQEKNERTEIAATIADLTTHANSLNMSDQGAVEVKKQLLAQIDDYNQKLHVLDGTIANNTQTVNGWTAAYQKTTAAIQTAKTATSGWTEILGTSFQQASKAGIDAAGKSIGDDIDTMMERVLGSKTKKGNPFQQAISSLMGTMVKSLFDGVFKQMTAPLEAGFQTLLGGHPQTGNAASTPEVQAAQTAGTAITTGAQSMTTAATSYTTTNKDTFGDSGTYDTISKNHFDANGTYDTTSKAIYDTGGVMDTTLRKAFSDAGLGSGEGTSTGFDTSGGGSSLLSGFNINAPGHSLAALIQGAGSGLGISSEALIAGASGNAPGGDPSSWFNSGGDWGNTPSGNTSSITNLFGLLKGGLAKSVSTAMAGFGIGEGLNGMLGGNSTWGTVGSAIGSGVGLIGGPLGSMIGGGLGGIIGGLFGNHTTAAEMPDVNDTQNYGQIMANLTGSAGANGQSFTEDPTLLNSLGGSNELAYIQNYLKSGGAGLTAAQIQQYTQEFGTSGDGTLTAGAHLNMQTVDGGGETASYTDLGTAAAAATQAILALKQAALQTAENAAQLAASFTSLMLGGPQGFTIPYITGGDGGNGVSSNPLVAGVNQNRVGTLPGTRAAGSVSTMSTAQAGGASSAAPAPITIHILENAQVSGNADDIANAIADMMPTIANQLTKNAYNDSKLFGKYVSTVS